MSAIETPAPAAAVADIPIERIPETAQAAWSVMLRRPSLATAQEAVHRAFEAWDSEDSGDAFDAYLLADAYASWLVLDAVAPSLRATHDTATRVVELSRRLTS